MKKKLSDFFISILSVIFILLLWMLISCSTKAELIFPSVFSVIIKIKEIIITPEFWGCFWHTFLRVNVSVFITILAGSFIGILCGYFPWVNQFLKIPVSIIRSTPVIAVILMALFWFTSTQVPVFVSVLMTLPVMISSVFQGFNDKNQNPINELLDMAKVYKLSEVQTFVKIRCPYAFPFFISGVQSVAGLSWKVICAGEVLSLPKYSIGYLMHSSQLHLESAELMGLTVLLVASSFVYEQILIILFKLIMKICTKGSMVEL